MAELDLSDFSEKELQALERKLQSRKGRKVDWENMSDEQRAQINKTTQPVTPPVPYQEYPKMIYGRRPNGGPIQARVENASDERKTKEGEPGTQWGTLLELGIETCPSKAPNKAVKIQMLGTPIDDVQIIGTDTTQASLPEVIATTPAQHPAAARRGPGRPRKDAAAA